MTWIITLVEQAFRNSWKGQGRADLDGVRANRFDIHLAPGISAIALLTLGLHG